MTGNADIGVIGLGVMGANLSLNLADSGNRVAVYNRTPAVTEAFMSEIVEGQEIVAAPTLEELVEELSRPRVVLMMVKSGSPVDAVLGSLLPLLDAGDIVIDGGNSHFEDTSRRQAELADEGIHYLGIGVSGGEEGARYGPSIMPGGSPEAWPHVEGMLKGIAAVAPDGTPCCEWLGPGGAGHFVKMVHNGIEYGDMQVIAEAYDIMRRGMGMTPGEIAEVFAGWNKGRLQSYLVEITAEILAATEDGKPVIDTILDAAGQKGTGAWTVIASMELAEPTALIAEAVYARIISSDPDRRALTSRLFHTPTIEVEGVTIDDVEAALYASKIISYAQGFRLLSAASEANRWGLDLGSVAALWRAGCIIRAVFLEDITGAYLSNPELGDLTDAEFFSEALGSAQESWRNVVSAAATAGIPVPAYSSALAYFDGFRSPRLPASLIQAQRDYFGAHTFERVDRPRGEFFHRNWGEAADRPG